MRNKFRDRAAVITGSSRGIGKAIAVELAKQGAFIVLNGRNEKRLKETEAVIRQIHGNVISFCGDVSDPETSQRLIRAAVDRFGRLDFLINNVGVSMRGTVAEVNPVVFQKVFWSNVLGTVNPTIPAIPHLRKTGGSVIFISSLAGIRGLPGLSAYCSSKMSLRAIAESLRLEEMKNGIHVGLVQVGMTEIEYNKETIAPDGTMRLLEMRDKSKVQTTGQVALAVLKNIEKRQFISTLTWIGRLNRFMQARFPMLVEKIILANLRKFEEGSR